MADGRAERMLGRMRGAQRHEVQDLSFGFDLGLESPGAPASAQRRPPPPGPQQRTTPNSSAKRRRLNNNNNNNNDDDNSPDGASAAPASQNAAPVRSQPRRAAKSSSPYDIPEHSEEERAALMPPPPTTTTTSGSSRRRDPAATPGRLLEEEVGESPADAPGSGSRRRVRISGAASQSAALQSVLGASSGQSTGRRDEYGDDDLGAASSPLTRKSRRSEAVSVSVSARSTRTGTRGNTHVSPTAGEEVDELSPISAVGPAPRVASSSPVSRSTARKSASQPVPSTKSASKRSTRGAASQNDVDELSPTGSVDLPAAAATSSPLVQRPKRRGAAATEPPAQPSTKKAARPATQASAEPDELSPEQVPRRPRGRPRKSLEEVPPPPPEPIEEEREEAEEIDENEAAAALGRRRPRRSLHEPSPELGSQPTEQPASAPKKRRKPAKESPAKQKHPKQPPQQQQQQQRKKNKADPKPQARKRKHVEVEAGEPVPVQVQRFTRKMHAGADDGTDTDILSAEIPYANRGGVNAVDVLAQMCEEIIDMSLEKLHESAVSAEDAATKREFRTKLRAVEAFQEELRTRLLEHTIALDTLHALKKRVRAAQKDKLTLRDEILSVRAEREQVALRMDAARARHEAERKEALHQIELSSTMHDIDLVVEKGQAAPELAPAEQKVAELNNLELLISRVADQACSRSSGGGVLSHIRGFNEFLERAAAVLEGR